MTIAKTATHIAKQVQMLPKKYPTPPRALLVGGFVRDYLLGITSNDIDIEVYGVDFADLKKMLAKLFPEKIDERGKSFGVLKIRTEKSSIDVALPREEAKNGRGYFGFSIKVDPNLSIKKAASRRDFTINAIALDPLTHEILDPFGGQKDLEKKILRAVNPKTFVEDPLRIYRGIQFAARFNLNVDSKTLQLMKKVAESGELKTLSKKRIAAELEKLKKSKNPSKGLGLAKKLGITI